jgi:polyisoprenoid-binding protein YceI
MSKLVGILLFFSFQFSALAQELKLKTAKAKVAFYFHGDKVNGSLDGFTATIKFNPEDPAKAEISGAVDVKTMQTGIKGRDKHLISEDFFHADKYPKMKFSASSVEKLDGYFLVKGKLTIKDVSREERFKLYIKEGKIVLKASINSADYGIMAKKKREDSQVDITIEIPLI